MTFTNTIYSAIIKESPCLDFPKSSSVWDHSGFESEKNNFPVQQGSEELLLDDANNHVVFEVVANFRRVSQEEENSCRDQRPPRIGNYPLSHQVHIGGQNHVSLDFYKNHDEKHANTPIDSSCQNQFKHKSLLKQCISQ